MKNLYTIMLTVIFIIGCSDSKNAKPNSQGEAPEVKQKEPIILKKKNPEAKTITLQEVSRIALLEANQLITNAKEKGIDYSSVSKILESAKKAYDDGEFKQAQKLAVSVRQKVEKLMMAQ
ncbi:MAG: hypothetical protein AB8B80_01625 [Marinicellaceae bacterium]